MLGPMQNIIFDTPHKIPFKKNVLQFDSSNNLLHIKIERDRQFLQTLSKIILVHFF